VRRRSWRGSAGEMSAAREFFDRLNILP